MQGVDTALLKNPRNNAVSNVPSSRFTFMLFSTRRVFFHSPLVRMRQHSGTTLVALTEIGHFSHFLLQCLATSL